VQKPETTTQIEEGRDVERNRGEDREGDMDQCNIIKLRRYGEPLHRTKLIRRCTEWSEISLIRSATGRGGSHSDSWHTDGSSVPRSSQTCKQFACTSQAEVSIAEKTMVTWNKSGY
jgi:hypothetical protein